MRGAQALPHVKSIAALCLACFACLYAAAALAEAAKTPPNIVLILIDDAGFGDASTFGGPVQTPALSQLAAEGLSYTNFNTAAMCSPTRAALLSGRNHHRVGFGFLAESSRSHPAYDGVWKKDTASVAQVLRSQGYSTAAFGKWHNTPSHEISAAGPFDRWPTGLGFDYFYGFMGWGASHWFPELYRNTTPIEPPATPEMGYHLTNDLTNQAIGWVQTHEALSRNKPYFLYFSLGATHGPHHVSPEWIDKFEGQFDQGWDALREETFARQKNQGVIPADTSLTPRPAQIPAWASLPAEQRKLLSRQMEIYAAFLAHTDHEIGRLLESVRQGPQADNTLIFYIMGDNGAAGEGGLNGQMDRHPNAGASLAEQLPKIAELGGPARDNLYSTGWAWAGSTPFQWYKMIASHFGSTRNPLVVSWPRVMGNRGGQRSQFTHVTDIVPTIYEAAGITLPDRLNDVQQQPLDGVSFADTLVQPVRPAPDRVQYFEIMGHRAIYQNGWVAAARNWSGWGGDFSIDQDVWALYHVAEDFSEAHDLAAKFPKKLTQMQTLFDAEAKRNNVYPLRPPRDAESADGPRDLVFYPSMPRTAVKGLPASITASSHRITAELVVPDGGAEGILFSHGGAWEGFVLYVKDGRLVYENNYANRSCETIKSDTELPSGRVEVKFEFVRDESRDGKPRDTGSGALYIDGKLTGSAKLSLRPELYYGSLAVGRSPGDAVSEAYQPPFAFSGTLERVRVELEKVPSN